MKVIALASLNYESTYGSYPSNIRGKDGKPLLSWRVAILPYIEEAPLYNEFHLDEAWDSPHNKRLIDRMPKGYLAPGATSKPGVPSYFAVNGPDTIMTLAGEGTKMAQITDGTSNTMMVVEAKRDIPWTKPEDIPFDAAKAEKMPEIGGYWSGGFNVLMCDGSVRFLKKAIDLKIFKAITTKAGAEIVDLNGL